MWKAIEDAAGFKSAIDKHDPTTGAFGGFLKQQLTSILYLEYLDQTSLLDRGRPLGADELVSMSPDAEKEFFARVGPYADAVLKYYKWYLKNDEYRRGIEHRVDLLRQRGKIGVQITDRSYELDEVDRGLNSWRRHLATCRQETAR